jgi:dTDP-glucose 4,6-dehydratase
MKTVLVTGALGVIGEHLTKSLRDRGHDVVGADLAVRDYTDYVRADVTAFEDLYRVFHERRPDVVIHMAGEVGRMVGEMHPQRMVYVNDVGVLNVIQLCLEHKAKLIYFSTSEVYGHLLDSDTPVTENLIAERASAFVTTNIYAMSKLYGEALVKHYVDNYGLDATGVRPFMVYGPGEAPSKYRSAISNFVHAARTGREIVVHEGTVRAWCFMSDFVEGVQLLVEQGAGTCYEAYNIGTDEYHTMEEVARTAIDVCGGRRDQIKVIPPPESFLSPKKRASIDKIKRLGFVPKVSMREGIKALADWQAASGF